MDLPLSYDALLGLALVTLFAGAAWLMRGVTTRGALAGAVVALTLYATAGPGGFAVLLTVFALTWLSTRLGYAHKQRLGMAEHARGRSAGQVLANLAVAAACSAAAAVTHRGVLLIAGMAALAEAAADTVSSESGEALSSSAYLITTMRRVVAGTDGAISLPGTTAGIAAAAIVAAVAAAARVVPWSAWLVIAGSGVLGTVVDSLLGATLERRGMIGNNGVNFVSTLAAAGIALVLMA